MKATRREILGVSVVSGLGAVAGTNLCAAQEEKKAARDYQKGSRRRGDPPRASSVSTAMLRQAGDPLGARFAIFEGCYESDGVKVCVTVDSDRVCASFYLVGNKLFDVCQGWSNPGEEVLTTTFRSDTLNSGIWKLQDPVATVSHNLASGDGEVRFDAVLFKLTLNGYKEKKNWRNEQVLSW